MNNNLYEVLHINKNSTKIEIKKSFMKLAKELHPDKNKNKNASAEFIKIKTAYDILINDVKRKQYDDMNDITKLSFGNTIFKFIKSNIPNLKTFINKYLNKNNINELDIILTIQCDLIDRYMDKYAYLEVERDTRDNIKLYVSLKNDVNIFCDEGESNIDYYGNGNIIINTEIINTYNFKINNSDISKRITINKNDYDNNNITFTHIDGEIINISKNDIIDNKYVILKEKGLPIQDHETTNYSRGDLVLNIIFL
jgi:DnaJ-class molecular chaperone